MHEPSEEMVLELLRESGATLEGHFLLSSGLHSAHYLQCALLLQQPRNASKLASWLAARYRSESVDLVVGPALGGIILAHEVARELGARALFTERKGAAMTLGRGFDIGWDERALLVEDVVTTGSSLFEVAGIVKSHGGRVVGVCAIVDRRGDPGWRLEQPLQSLIQLRIPVYDPTECPLCREGIPIKVPGSRRAS